MFTVYVLGSQNTGMLYVGQTEDLDRRLAEHNSGLARYTRGRGPWQVVLTEEYESRTAAMRRERFFKSGQGREFLKKKLSGRAGPPQAD